MTEIEVLNAALPKEENAIRFYEEMIDHHPSLKDLLYTLLSQEEQHKHQIERKIVELTRYW